MAPINKTFRTYSRKSNNLSSVTAFDILFANNLTQRKLAKKGIAKKKNKIELKELPKKVKSTVLSLTDESLHVNVNETFDKLKHPCVRNGLKGSFSVFTQSHNVTNSSNPSRQIRMLRSFNSKYKETSTKHDATSSDQPISWFLQHTPTGEAIINSLEIEKMSQNHYHFTASKDCSKHNEKHSSIVLRSHSQALPKTASVDLSKSKNDNHLQTIADTSKPKTSSRNRRYNGCLNVPNPIFTNSVRENIHSSTPLVSKTRQVELTQPIISPIVQKEKSKDEIQNCINESLQEIGSWDCSLPKIDVTSLKNTSGVLTRSRHLQLRVQLEPLPPSLTCNEIYKKKNGAAAEQLNLKSINGMSISQEEFEKFHEESLSGAQKSGTKKNSYYQFVTKTSINQEDFEKFHDHFINGSSYKLRNRLVTKKDGTDLQMNETSQKLCKGNSNRNDISSDLLSETSSAIVSSLNDFEKFEQSYYTSYCQKLSCSISSFLGSGRKQSRFVTHRKHKLSAVNTDLRNGHLLKNLLVVLDKNQVNFSKNGLLRPTQSSYILRSNRNIEKQLFINITRLTLNKLKEQCQAKSLRQSSRIYKACRKFSSNSQVFHSNHFTIGQETSQLLMDSMIAEIARSISQSSGKLKPKEGSYSRSVDSSLNSSASLRSGCSSEKENEPSPRPTRTSKHKNTPQVLFKSSLIDQSSIINHSSCNNSKSEPNLSGIDRKKTLTKGRNTTIDTANINNTTSPFKGFGRVSCGTGSREKEYVCQILALCENDCGIEEGSRRSSRHLRNRKTPESELKISIQREPDIDRMSQPPQGDKSYIAEDLSDCITSRNDQFEPRGHMSTRSLAMSGNSSVLVSFIDLTENSDADDEVEMASSRVQEGVGELLIGSRDEGKSDYEVSLRNRRKTRSSGVSVDFSIVDSPKVSDRRGVFSENHDGLLGKNSSERSSAFEDGTARRSVRLRKNDRLDQSFSGAIENSIPLAPHQQSLNQTEEYDGFKIPSNSVFQFNPTLRSGKSWRRSLVQQRNSSCNSFSDRHRPFIRMSAVIVPSSKDSRLRRKSVLQHYVESTLPLGDITNEIMPNYTSTPQKSTDLMSARNLVLKHCNQSDPVPFKRLFSDSTLRDCRKIGEGVYGEVFIYSRPDGESTVMKVIPIEGNLIVNGEKQKRFHEILPEVTITSKLSDLRNGKLDSSSGFCEVQRACCVIGRYPDTLLRLWHDYSSTKGTENDPPDMFKEDQLYMVLELSNAGQDLEAFVFNNAMQAISVFRQIAYALAIAEEQLEFEHRDLHWGNILIKKVNRYTNITFKRKGKTQTCASNGVQATIIDFTLSRMALDGVKIFTDLAVDPDLFMGQGDYQFDIYRLMRERNSNDWKKFTPYTNVLWLHYVLVKSITALRYKNTKTKVHLKYIDVLKEYRDRILSCDSVSDFVDKCF